MEAKFFHSNVDEDQAELEHQREQNLERQQQALQRQQALQIYEQKLMFSADIIINWTLHAQDFVAEALK